MQGGIKINSPLVKNKTARGFTIVETMIVLAVTGVLFFSVMAVMAGRQNRTQFQQSINAMKVEIEQVVSQVQTGYYPSTQNFRCSAAPAGGLQITSAASGNEQGTNKDCVFFGKAIQFKVGGEDRYAVIPLAGLREASTFANSRAKAVTQSINTGMLQYGLEPKWVKSGGVIGTGTLGFVTTIDGASEKGSQSIQVIPVPSDALNRSTAQTVSTIDANIASATAVDNAQICYQSGVTDQYGIVSITGGGAVSLKIDNGDCPS